MYTPPAMKRARDGTPALSDSDAWRHGGLVVTVGRANYILDNLLAEKKARADDRG